MIVVATSKRGLALEDLKRFTIGGIVDYIITWNNLTIEAEVAGVNPKEATMDDIKRFKSM